MNWYALYTSGGTEEKAKSILEQQLPTFEFLIFKRRLKERKNGQWHIVDRKMFPGYVLMKGMMTEEAWYDLKATDAKFQILKVEGEYQTLSNQEVKMLELLDQDASGLVDRSSLYIDGEKVIVTEGPLKGQEAMIVSVNKRKGRAKVKIDFCGNIRIVELGVELIEKSDNKV